MIVKSTREQGELYLSVGQRNLEDSAPVFLQTQLLNNTEYSYFLYYPLSHLLPLFPFLTHLPFLQAAIRLG